MAPHGSTHPIPGENPYSSHQQIRNAATTAATPASEVEAVVRSPTNMAAAKIAAVDFINKMTSK